MLTFYQKSTVATILVALALAQLGAISYARGWIGSAGLPARRRLTLFHRYEGYAGLALILWLAFNCIFVIGPHLRPAPRVSIHVFLGPVLIGLIFGKVLIGRGFPQRLGQMPVLGVLLLTAIAVQWLLSGAWFFLQYFTGILATH